MIYINHDPPLAPFYCGPIAPLRYLLSKELSKTPSSWSRTSQPLDMVELSGEKGTFSNPRSHTEYLALGLEASPTS